MNVTIKLGGPLRKKIAGHKRGEIQMKLRPGATVTTALGRLGLDTSDVKVMMLGGRPVSQDAPLGSGDRLALFPPELAYNMYVAINFRHRLPRENR